MNNIHEDEPKEQPETFDYAYEDKLSILINTSLANFKESLEVLQNGKNEYSIKCGLDLKPFVESIAIKDAEIANEISKLRTVTILEINSSIPDDQNGLHERTILFLEDTDGNQSSVTLALHGTAKGVLPVKGEPFNPLIHGGNFGGMGRYAPDNQEHILLFGLKHAEGLATVMDSKAKTCNFPHLAGSKAVITNIHTSSSNTNEVWLNNPAMQYATGMIFSKRGPQPFKKVITGSDAGQTQETIDRLGKGSRMADENSYNIVGTSTYGFQGTAGFVEYSMEATYRSLQEAVPNYLPSLNKATAAVQGFGKIGSTTVEMYLKAGSKVYIADKLFDFPIKDLTGEDLKRRQSMEALLKALQAKYPEKLMRSSTTTIWEEPVDIISPCSNQEGILNKELIDKLAKNGKVKLILSGANNVLESAEIAEYAYLNYGIQILPEVISNNGSAIAAGLEPKLLYELHRKTFPDIETCIQNVLIPYIKECAAKNVDKIIAKYKTINEGLPEEQRISFYEIGRLIFNS